MKSNLLKISVLILSVVFATTTYAGYSEVIKPGLTSSEQQELMRLAQDQHALLNQEARFEQEVSNLDRQVNQLNRELDRARAEVESAFRELQNSDNRVRQLKDDVVRLQREVQSARQRREQQIRQLESQIAQAASQIESQDAKIQKLEKELQEIYNTRNPAGLPGLRAEIASLQNQKAPHQTSYDNALKGLKHWEQFSEEDCMASMSCMSQRQQLRNQRDAAKKEMDKIDKLISVKQAEIDRINEAERLYAAKEQEVNRAKQALAQIEQSIIKNEAQIRELRSKPLREEEQLERAQFQLTQEESRRHSLQRNADDRRMAYDRKEREFRDVDQRLRERVSQLNVVRNQIQRNELRISDLERKVSKQVVLLGSKLSAGERNELVSLNVPLLIAETSSVIEAIQDSRSRDVVMLVDSIVVVRLAQGLLLELAQLVREGGVVTLVGRVEALSALSESAELLSTCRASHNSSVGLVTICR